MYNSPVAQIKERLTIEEVVSSYIKLTKAGSTLRANCPFHNEKTPSFFVSPDRGTYYCFGCGAGGDIFTFVEEFEGLDFKGTLKLLAERAGVALVPVNQEVEGEKERLYKAMEESTRFFEKNIENNPAALTYLKNRGLTYKSIKDFRIGFANSDWRDLHNHLRSKGFSDLEVEKAGLIKKTDRGYYDRFRGRIMFPINDSSGRVVAFSGRIFIDDGKSAKYLNSPETPIFSKSAVLYGIDKAKDAIRKNNFSILVEGQMDLILSHQAGFKNTVASSGTALSDNEVSKENAVSNLGLIRRLSNNIVLGFDGDKAGINATKRAGKIALLFGMDVKVANLKEGLDPADLISKDGPLAWKKSIKESKHIVEFLLEKVIKSNNDPRKIGREVKDDVLPFICEISSSIERALLVKKISDLSGIPVIALEEDINTLAKELNGKEQSINFVNDKKNQHDVFRKDRILRRLLGVWLWQLSLKNPSLDPSKIEKELKLILSDSFEQTISHVELNKEDYIFEAEVFYTNNEDLITEVTELLSNLKEEALKDNLALKVKELALAERDKDINKINTILKEYQVIINKIEELKNSRVHK